MGSKVKIVQAGLDERVAEERAILDTYHATIDGRKSDFLRNCLVAGYKVLYGQVVTPTLFAHIPTQAPVERPATSPAFKKVEKPYAEIEEEIQVKPEQKTVENSKPKPRLVGFLGNQE